MPTRRPPSRAKAPCLPRMIRAELARRRHVADREVSSFSISATCLRLHPLDQLMELSAHQSKTRRNRTDKHPDEIGDLRNRHAFPFEEKECRAHFDRQRVHEFVEPGSSTFAVQKF